MQEIHNTQVYTISNGIAVIDPMGLSIFPTNPSAPQRLVKGELLVLACEVFDYFQADPELRAMIEERWPPAREEASDVAEPAAAAEPPAA